MTLGFNQVEEKCFPDKVLSEPKPQGWVLVDQVKSSVGRSVLLRRETTLCPVPESEGKKKYVLEFQVLNEEQFPSIMGWEKKGGAARDKLVK